MTPRRWHRGAIAAALIMAATTALACPVCYDAGSPDGLRSYYTSTLMLSVLPFFVVGLIAAVGVGLARRSPPLETPDTLTTR